MSLKTFKGDITTQIQRFSNIEDDPKLFRFPEENIIEMVFQCLWHK